VCGGGRYGNLYSHFFRGHDAIGEVRRGASGREWLRTPTDGMDKGKKKKKTISSREISYTKGEQDADREDF